MEETYEDQLRTLLSTQKRKEKAVERRKRLTKKAGRRESRLLPEGALEAALVEERAAQKQLDDCQKRLKDIIQRFGLMAPFKIVYHVFHAVYNHDDPDWVSKGGNHPEIKTHPD